MGSYIVNILNLLYNVYMHHNMKTVKYVKKNHEYYI